jgi:acylpyruvate hydrolase
MKLTRINVNGEVTLARVEDSELVILPFGSFQELLDHPQWRVAAQTEGPRLAFDKGLLTRLLEPAQIFCVGLNYKGHILETGRPTPEFPTLFAKFSSALTGPYSEIPYSTESNEVDWEVELGVVIAVPARNVSVEKALDYVAGYTVVNDISMRDWQRRTPQLFQGKNFQASTPVGPWLVTPDEINHARDLRITCSIDGEKMQDGRTSDLLFSSAELISYISRFTTLLPGDLILTGTPSGVGMAREPKRFLQPGEILTSEIEGIGMISNMFAAIQK